MARESLGRPDDSEKGSVSGLMYERWTYHRYNLEFQFENFFDAFAFMTKLSNTPAI